LRILLSDKISATDIVRYIQRKPWLFWIIR